MFLSHHLAPLRTRLPEQRWVDCLAWKLSAASASGCTAGRLPPGEAEPGDDWAGRSHRRGLLPATGAGSHPGPPVCEWAGAGDGEVCAGAAHQVRGADTTYYIDRQPAVMLVSHGKHLLLAPQISRLGAPGQAFVLLNSLVRGPQVWAATAWECQPYLLAGIQSTACGRGCHMWTLKQPVLMREGFVRGCEIFA